MRLSTGCAGWGGRNVGDSNRGRFVPSGVTGRAAPDRAYPELIPHSPRSVKTLDIHTLHSAYCYGLRDFSIKRNTMYGGQLS